MSFLDLSILDVLPKVVADGSDGGVHLYAEVTPESYRSFIYKAFLFTEKEGQKGTRFSYLTTRYIRYMYLKQMMYLPQSEETIISRNWPFLSMKLETVTVLTLDQWYFDELIMKLIIKSHYHAWLCVSGDFEGVIWST